MDRSIYYQKYTKYKSKYLALKNSLQLGGSIKNSAIVLFTGNKADRIVLLRDRRTKKWMLPGGQIDKSDKSPFYAMIREFREETGYKMPKIGKVCKYNYHGHTMIYKGWSPSVIKFKKTNETDKIHFAKINDVFSGKFEKKYGRIKKYVMRSLLKMRSVGFI